MDAIRRVGVARTALVISGFLFLIAFGAALAGYRAGLAKNASLSATETAAEVARQYQLGLQDLADGRFLTAAERFRFVVSLDPQFPDAAEKLAEAEERLDQTAISPTAPALGPTVDPRVAPNELLGQAQIALGAGDWDGAISLLTQIKAGYPAFESERVKSAFHTAFQGRGIARIGAFRLQEGIFDLDQAETYGGLDKEASAQRVWATLYVRGSALWGANWPAAISIFHDLYLAAPYFHDTISRMHGAYVGYGDQLWAQGDPCGAVYQYANAKDVLRDATVEAKRRAAVEACAEITPTPSEGTPSVTPAGTPASPDRTAEPGTAASTDTPAP
jgi:tetratricopeptide (TPR) repeat protein